ncbi:hypothetical protein GALL_449550 [mine drainage metagenome]|uniref:Uncharacterized protein n=1 Tax=mine drainage metagenome TaxID=410659 RepID=A0A1J5PQJ6_9ZZZZ
MNTRETFILSTPSSSKSFDRRPNSIDKHPKHFLALQCECENKGAKRIQKYQENLENLRPSAQRPKQSRTQ